MNRKSVLNTVGLLAAAASAGMYMVGKNSSHLTELKDFFWVPLVVAVFCFIAANMGKKV